TLVLVNGWRQHQTALANNFTYGMGAGSSGVELNTMPQSALDRIAVLRDGAAARAGADAVPGAVSLPLKERQSTPYGHGDGGLEKDVLTMANFRMPLNEARTSELYAFGGYSFRRGTGNGYRRCAVDCASFITGRAWPQIYPLGYLPEFHPDVADYSVAGGFRGATH